MVDKERSGIQRRPPLNIDLSLRVVFGSGPGEAVQLFDGARVPLVGSVFQARDHILRGLIRTLLKAGTTHAGIAGGILPPDVFPAVPRSTVTQRTIGHTFADSAAGQRRRSSK